MKQQKLNRVTLMGTFLIILSVALAACAPAGTPTSAIPVTGGTGTAAPGLGLATSTVAPGGGLATSTVAAGSGLATSTTAPIAAAGTATPVASTAMATTPMAETPMASGTMTACSATPSAQSGTPMAETATPMAATPAAGTTTTPAAASGTMTPYMVTSICVSNNSSLGNFLVDDRGMTLYTFKKDTSGTSNCNGTCATNWPPVTAQAVPTAGSGVSGTLALITRSDGSKQLTYNGMPLYYFSGDKAPGDTNGQGVGGVWAVATP